MKIISSYCFVFSSFSWDKDTKYSINQKPKDKKIRIKKKTPVPAVAIHKRSNGHGTGDRKGLAKLAQIPEAALIDHRNDHFLARPVSIEEGKKYIAGMLGCIHIGPHNIYPTDAVALILLLSYKHLCVGNELLTINSRDAVGLIVPVYKQFVLPFEQLIIIGLGCLGSNIIL